jgi:hypothetical protein
VLCLPDTLADQFIVPLDEIHAEGGHFPAIRFVHKYGFKLNIKMPLKGTVRKDESSRNKARREERKVF